jgi:hypothetical protein
MESNIKIELVKLAKEKGFVSEFIGSKSYFPDKPWLMPEKEDFRWYLWMCELQKWLLKLYYIHITIDRDDLNWFYQLSNVEKLTDDYYFPTLSPSRAGHKSYEEALAEGLSETLKII